MSGEEQYIDLQIIISDTGCGISEEGLKHLFIDFGMLGENQDRNKSGTGLGLSICKQIIEQMGGSVHVQSTLGVGTQFIINIKTKCKVTDTEFLSDSHIEGHSSDNSDDMFEMNSKLVFMQTNRKTLQLENKLKLKKVIDLMEESIFQVQEPECFASMNDKIKGLQQKQEYLQVKKIEMQKHYSVMGG